MAAAFTPAPSPAAGPPQDPTAVFGRRVVAAGIDLLVVTVPGVAISSSTLESFDVSGSGLDGAEFCDEYIEQFDDGACLHFGDTAYFSDGGFGAANLAPLGLALLLFVLVQGLTGRTIGKALLGLRTVKEDGSVVGVGRALLRWLLWVVDALPCFWLVALMTAGTSTGHRRVGDIVARTYVVRASAAGRPIDPAGTSPAHGAPGTGSWVAASPVTGTPTEPQWDAARGTYIQWDAGTARWLQWDDTAHTWTVIPGQ